MSWLRCVAKAVVKYGVKALGEGIPFGGVLRDMAVDAWNAYQQGQPKGAATPAAIALAGEVQHLAVASPPQLQQEVQAAVQEAAGDQPVEVQRKLAAYLTQMPATIRRSLRRPSDPSGTTLPPGLSLKKPADVLPFLPPRPPRFQPGDRPLAGVPLVLEELLGVGGFGEVWKAGQPGYAVEPVALKFCLDNAAGDLLHKEAQNLNRIMREGRHVGIVPLKRLYLDTQPVCLEYEFVNGGDLCGLIRELHARGKPSGDTVARWMLHLCDAVRFAHRLTPALVHRDLKPANILVQQHGTSFRLRITDFGISHVVAGQSETIHNREATALALGAYTPLYASPQQMRGDPADPRDDIHALGVIWYQTLTGDLMSGVGADYAHELRDQGVAEEQIDLLGRCVAGKADRRPKHAGELLDSLNTLLKTPQTKPTDGGSASGLASKVRETTQKAKRANDEARRLEKEQQYAVAVAQFQGIPDTLIDMGLLTSLTEKRDEEKRLRQTISQLCDAGRFREVRGPVQRLVALVGSWDVEMRELLDSLPPPERQAVNSLGMKFVLVEPGTFLMGSPSSEEGHGPTEIQHEVEITSPFYLGVFQVTQDEYQRVMDSNPSYFSTSGGGADKVKGMDTRRFPVEQASWTDAVAFCEKLSQLPEEKKAGRTYRLPTEAEWEYSCREGAGFKNQVAPFYFKTPISSLCSTQANFDGNNPYGGAAKGTHLQRPCPVGSYQPNRLGLYDMHGNIWEWCLDWYDENYYNHSPRQNPQGPQTGTHRVLRGGSWLFDGFFCRAAVRIRFEPGNRYFYLIGFRVVCLLP